MVKSFVPDSNQRCRFTRPESSPTRPTKPKTLVTPAGFEPAPSTFVAWRSCSTELWSRTSSADGRTRTRIDLFRKQAPKSIQPRPQAAKPGVEPGFSRVKAELVASYTTSQYWWLGPDSNRLPLELHTSALPNELPNPPIADCGFWISTCGTDSSSQSANPQFAICNHHGRQFHTASLPDISGK